MMLRILFCISLLLVGTGRAAENEGETAAHKIALDVAGAFTNEGFKMRDGHWCGNLKLHEPTVIAVNLYAGNQYWFSAGADEKAKKLAVKVFDEAGRSISAEPYDAESRAAAGFSPTVSGQYFVAVEITEGESADVCLLYSYK